MQALSLARTMGRSTWAPGGRVIQTGYVLTDLFFIFLNGFAVFYFRFVPNWLPDLLRGERPRIPDLMIGDEYLGFLLLFGALIVLFCHSQDLYRTVRTRSALDESLAVVTAVIAATILLTASIYLSNIKVISRLVVGGSAVLNIATLAAWRLWRRQIVEGHVAAGRGTRNVLIIGAGKIGQELARYLDGNRTLGLAVKGFLDQNHSAEPRLLGRIEDLASLARAHFVDEIFVTIPSAREVVRAVALEARRNHLDVKVVPELYDGLGWRAPLEYVGDFPVLSLHREPIPVLGLLAKRAMDILVSAVGLIVLSPLLAAIAIAIKLDSPGPAFYLSTRVGKKGRKFTCYKLRSMVVNADALKDGLRNLNQRCGPTFKISHDPRITRLGCFLRQTSLDELPQLGNVLKGDMSLVGPRPPSTDDFDQYSLEHLRRLDVTPGITGLWQISARRDPSFERNMALDIEYIENWNLWLDLKILLRTLPAVVAGHGE